MGGKRTSREDPHLTSRVAFVTVSGREHRSGPVGRLLTRAWRSTTLTTWASQSTRAASLLLVLPLLLRRFESSELAAWYLFTGLITLSALADFGFRSTFVRVIAFAAGGADHVGVHRADSARTPAAGGMSPNWALIERLVAVMRWIYAQTSIGVVIALAVLGTAALIRPLAEVPVPSEAWTGWLIICVTAMFEFRGRVYKNYLEGLNFIALARRVEVLTRLGAIGTSLIVMVTAPTLLNLVIADRSWAMLNVLRDWHLARNVEGARWKAMRNVGVDGELLRTVWRPAWRSGVAGLMSNGLTGLTGIFYAQIGSASSLASYLLGLRLITEVRNLSNAPLYSKLPMLGRLRAAHNSEGAYAVARRGMNISYAVFCVGAIIVGLIAPMGLKAIESNTSFVPANLWWLLTLAFLAHRVGSMHLQYYQSTNDVVAHIVDGLSGALFVLSTALFIPRWDVYAFPLAMLVGYLGVHSWVSIYYSFMASGSNRRAFVRDFLFPPLVAIVAVAVAWMISGVSAFK